MAKVNLQIKDRPDGKISFRLTSHPEAGPDPDDFTPAQKMGLALITHMSHLKPIQVRKEQEYEQAPSPAPGTPPSLSAGPSPLSGTKIHRPLDSRGDRPGITLSQLEGSGF